MKKGIIYYTDSQLDEHIAELCRQQIQTCATKNDIDSIVSASLQPLNFGKNIHLPLKRGYHTMFVQILSCLETSDADIIYFTEHDVLYHPSHFEFIPERGRFFYNHNFWKVREDGMAAHWDADQVSGLCGHRDELVRFYQERVKNFNEATFDRRFEPMSGNGAQAWKSPYPNIDIRHKQNLTGNKWSLSDFRRKDTAKNFELSVIYELPGWPKNLQEVIYSK